MRNAPWAIKPTEYALKIPASSPFCEIQECSKKTATTKISLDQPRLADETYAKLSIFNKPAQTERNSPVFHTHTVCSLRFNHFSELNIILK